MDIIDQGPMGGMTAEDEVKRLRAENERLTKLFAESCSDMRAEGHYDGLGQCPQIEKLESENERLKRAVEKAVDQHENFVSCGECPLFDECLHMHCGDKYREWLMK